MTAKLLENIRLVSLMPLMFQAFQSRYIHMDITAAMVCPEWQAGRVIAFWPQANPAIAIGLERGIPYDWRTAAPASGARSGLAEVAPAPEKYHELSSSFPPDTARMFWRVFPSVMLPIFMAVGDQTIVSSALPAIAGALGDVERVSWIVIGYLIASTIAAPVYGYLGDIFGRRRLLFLALAIFMTGSVLNSLAPTVTLLAASRFLQGLGGGGLMSMAQALLAEVIPPRERGRYQGYNATVFVTASALGPVLGAFLTVQFGWRAVFFINIPVGILAFLLALRLPDRRGAARQGWSFDFPGLLFFVAFIVPLLIALEQLRRMDAAGMTLVVALVALSVVSLVLLLRQERRTQSPLLPVDLMRQTAVWNSQLMIVGHGAMMTALLAFLPLFMRVTNIGSVQDVGVALLIFSAAIAASSIIVGRLVSRTGLTMVFPAIGMTFATGILVWFAFNASTLSRNGLFMSMAAIAFSMGSVMSVCQVTVQNAAGRKLLGAASGSIQLARTVGAVFGTALFATILFAWLAMRDPEAAKQFGAILNQGADALKQFPPGRAAAISNSIAEGFRAAFLMLACLATISTLLAWFNPSRRI